TPRRTARERGAAWRCAATGRRSGSTVPGNGPPRPSAHPASAAHRYLRVMREARVLVAAMVAALTAAWAQVPPDPDFPDMRPELHDYLCRARGSGADGPPPEPRSEAELLRWESRARYRQFFPAYLA